MINFISVYFIWLLFLQLLTAFHHQHAPFVINSWFRNSIRNCAKKLKFVSVRIFLHLFLINIPTVLYQLSHILSYQSLGIQFISCFQYGFCPFYVIYTVSTDDMFLGLFMTYTVKKGISQFPSLKKTKFCLFSFAFRFRSNMLTHKNFDSTDLFLLYWICIYIYQLFLTPISAYDTAELFMIHLNYLRAKQNSLDQTMSDSQL